MNRPYDAILMVGFGGPARPGEIRPFLQNVAKGRPIPPARLEEVAHHYERIGGRSPYNQLVSDQAGALRELLARDGRAIPVYAGMRNWAPYVRDVMRDIAAGGAQRIFCFPMAPHRCEASWDRYLLTVSDALAALGTQAPAAGYPEPWHDHPLFVRAVAARIHDAIQDLTAAERSRMQVIFTAHSIPIAMDTQSAYSAQTARSCELAARELGLARWTLAWQSRSGNPREPWLQPEIGPVLAQMSGQVAVVMPIGFICDHVEVLYDLDIEAASIARESGVLMRRAGTVGSHPLFIEMIAQLSSRGARAKSA
jgi:protoporphyrin/coproporphyrin ferrochelatase